MRSNGKWKREKNGREFNSFALVPSWHNPPFRFYLRSIGTARDFRYGCVVCTLCAHCNPACADQRPNRAYLTSVELPSAPLHAEHFSCNEFPLSAQCTGTSSQQRQRKTTAGKLEGKKMIITMNKIAVYVASSAMPLIAARSSGDLCFVIISNFSLFI